MLVLTRKQNEKIRIGNEIIVTVLRTKGKGVRLGIEAPAHINVLRGELVFDLPAEELKPESSGGKGAVETASRETAQAGGHREQPASLWPTTPDSQTPNRQTPNRQPPNRQPHLTGPNITEPNITEPDASRNPRPSRQKKSSSPLKTAHLL